MIVVEDVYKRYHTVHGPGKWVLRGVNLTIPTNVSVGTRRLGLRSALLTVYGFSTLGSVAGTAATLSYAGAALLVALALAVLGGVIALLAFGAGALFLLLNTVLAFEFTADAAHDLWHLISDASVGAVVAWWHWRVLRAERAEDAPAEAVQVPLWSGS